MRTRIKGRLDPLSDLDIERYLCDDLTPEERAHVERAISASAELAAHVARRRSEQAEFFQAHPRLSQPEARPARARWMPLAISAAAAGLLAAVLLITLPGDAPRNGIRARGTATAELAVLRDGRTFTYRDGVLLRAGDRVRLSVQSPTGGFLSLIARCGPSRMEIYYDNLEAHAGTYTVPDSLILDDGVEAEEWIVILSPDPIPARSLADTIRAHEPLQGAVSVIRVVKEALP
ncbi:MAG: hypothetical protein JXR96_28110 [Deltaproteobacteria bacterium]|nr:hypothetical protein [Deltaproteobacteria bacterium]